MAWREDGFELGMGAFSFSVMARPFWAGQLLTSQASGIAIPARSSAKLPLQARGVWPTTPQGLRAKEGAPPYGLVDKLRSVFCVLGGLTASPFGLRSRGKLEFPGIYARPSASRAGVVTFPQAICPSRVECVLLSVVGGLFGGGVFNKPPRH